MLDILGNMGGALSGVPKVFSDNWGEVLIIWLFAQIVDYKMIAKWFVGGIRKLVPPPFKKPMLLVCNNLAKAIDKEIPDPIKASGV